MVKLPYVIQTKDHSQNEVLFFVPFKRLIISEFFFYFQVERQCTFPTIIKEEWA